MTAFITGSHAYGTVHEESDIDLVILMDKEEALSIIEQIEPWQFARSGGADSKAFSVKFGKLNLIMCIDETHFNSWKQGTETLKAEAPVSRETAIKVFKGLFAREPQRIFGTSDDPPFLF